MAESLEVIEVQVIAEAEEAEIKDKNAAQISEATASSLQCKLCLDEITSGKKFTMEACGCFFCNDCMKTYITVLIKDGVALSITCPDAECVIQGELEVHEIHSLLDDEETFQKYAARKYDQEVAVDPNRTFCPNPNCSNVCYLHQTLTHKDMKKRRKEKKTKKQIPQQVTCHDCQWKFCHICKSQWSDGHKCIDPFNDRTAGGGDGSNSGSSKNEHQDAVIKRCPVCNILIEKDRGCAQMICKNCSHVFCWYCLKLLDNDFMLRHYDKGPCKNFLGHSRSQVLRHRLGVVGLFAAFSLLLVVALPILILAAPVFLCCKWKECCYRAYRRAQVENNNALFEELEREMEKYKRENLHRTSMQIVSEVQNRASTDLTPPQETATEAPDPQPPPHISAQTTAVVVEETHPTVTVEARQDVVEVEDEKATQTTHQNTYGTAET